MPFDDGAFGAVVSWLVLNFVPDSALGLSEMRRVLRPGGTVAAYVWDYAGHVQMLRYCWDAALAADPVARDLDEGRRFQICQPRPLRSVFETARLTQVQVRAIDIATDFVDFVDCWSPVLGSSGASAKL